MTGDKLASSHGKNKRNFSASSSSLNQDSQPRDNDGALSGSSHRSFLKKMNSRGSRSISPQTSSSSISSFFRRNPTQSESDTSKDRFHFEHDVGSPVNPYQDSHSSLNEDTGASESDRSSVKKYDEKESEKQKSHSHLSLRRFFKKFKIESDSKKAKKYHQHHTHHLHKSHSELFKKYGEVGRLLGTGASGSVNILRSKDNPNKVYAIKKFRARLPREAESDYKAKVKNEFKIGEILYHENLIHTIELIKDHTTLMGDPDYYIVMDYCPYDFFNLVMSGLMSQEEVACYFKQIVNGVNHLHQNGLAHRDLKLDNCVVTTDGILKLIDFGSAVQFRKELVDGTHKMDIIDDKYRLVRARGIVGSDPYLAPEVFEPSNFGYDPRLVDVWSVAIIFCCMSLKRFPWKIPKYSDPSYRAFAEEQQPDVVAGVENLNVNDDPHHHKRSPSKLMKLIPAQSASLVKSMLTVDPTKRAFIEDVVASDFYKSIAVCHVEGDKVVKARNHIHHLITEEELQQIQQEKDKSKKKANGSTP
ncbi:putative serine/threonine-protein kinase RTK1 [Meyerozyma sp. JA9]|nr:putative serine/threonine-protein kinase RTK1 [Meyerozyma sp. JA9]